MPTIYCLFCFSLFFLLLEKISVKKFGEKKKKKKEEKKDENKEAVIDLGPLILLYFHTHTHTEIKCIYKKWHGLSDSFRSITRQPKIIFAEIARGARWDEVEVSPKSHSSCDTTIEHAEWKGTFAYARSEWERARNVQKVRHWNDRNVMVDDCLLFTEIAP